MREPVSEEGQVRGQLLALGVMGWSSHLTPCCVLHIAHYQIQCGHVGEQGQMFSCCRPGQSFAVIGSNWHTTTVVLCERDIYYRCFCE